MNHTHSATIQKLVAALEIAREYMDECLIYSGHDTHFKPNEILRDMKEIDAALSSGREYLLRHGKLVD